MWFLEDTRGFPVAALNFKFPHTIDRPQTHALYTQAKLICHQQQVKQIPVWLSSRCTSTKKANEKKAVRLFPFSRSAKDQKNSANIFLLISNWKTIKKKRKLTFLNFTNFNHVPSGSDCTTLALQVSSCDPNLHACGKITFTACSCIAMISIPSSRNRHFKFLSSSSFLQVPFFKFLSKLSQLNQEENQKTFLFISMTAIDSESNDEGVSSQFQGQIKLHSLKQEKNNFNWTNLKNHRQWCRIN